MHIETWPFETYPEMDNKGRLLSKYWRVGILKKDGFVKFQQVTFTEPVSEMGCSEEIADVVGGLRTIRKIELDEKGPVIVVQMGCAHVMDSPGGDWRKLDLIKEAPGPDHYYEGKFTKMFWDIWRPAAYPIGVRDPFQFKRPERVISNEDRLTQQINALKAQMEGIRKEGEASRAALKGLGMGTVAPGAGVQGQ